VSDQALLLLPCEAAIFWARGSRREWRSASLLAAGSAAAALIWPVVRLIEFWRRNDLPAGISGTIEFTGNFPLLALIQPNFLPFTNTQRSLSLKHPCASGILSRLCWAAFRRIFCWFLGK
jgi:hypothetical protein